MLLKIIKFASKGIQLDTQTTIPVEVAKKRLKRYSLIKAILGKTQGLVARTYKENATIYRLGVPIVILGKPVLYVHITPDESGSRISGRFTFSIFSRVIFWLAHLAVLTLFGLGIFRMVIAESNDEPTLWYIYGTFAFLLGGLLGFLIYSWYGWTWQNRRSDMDLLAEHLKFVLSAKAPASNHKSQ